MITLIAFSVWGLVGFISVFLVMSYDAYRKFKEIQITPNSDTYDFKQVTKEYTISGLILGTLGGPVTPIVIGFVYLYDWMYRLVENFKSERRSPVEYFADKLQEHVKRQDKKQYPEKYL